MLTARESALILNIGVSTWWKGVKEGRFPTPIRFGRSTRWRRADIEALFAPAE
ncbi:helix-turn-helix transcriptional regulator [Paracoccus fontiphilus]|uniref:Helix-turn-helix transcriptional regulator n=2 Tax=Paracoccus fontiphilus TaxID=1815556 RepID=A0ABV7IDL9_9RHOB|nr:helix-turn-helix domain-containing protein [Paracoccus fontiphilus]